MKDLNKIFNDCITDLDKIGIEYGNITKVNSKASKSWLGETAKDGDEYTITISTYILENDVPDLVIKNTIIHEILHTCKDCMCHTGEWKRLAELVMCYYPSYTIQRTATDYEMQFFPKSVSRPYKYTIVCPNCGKQFHYKNLCDAVKHPSDYICGDCKTRLIRYK